MSTDDWCTPPEVDDCLFEFWGGPCDLDPCSNSVSIIRAKKALTAGGLHLPWKRHTFENNPYSKMLRWVDKSGVEVAKGHVRELVTLWPVATSTVWWKRAVGLEPIPPFAEGEKEIWMPNPQLVFPKRLAFLDENGQKVSGCRFDSVLFFYGKTERRRKDFLHAFSNLTNWSTKGR